jgi:hypothetical protein
MKNRTLLIILSILGGILFLGCLSITINYFQSNQNSPASSSSSTAQNPTKVYLSPTYGSCFSLDSSKPTCTLPSDFPEDVPLYPGSQVVNYDFTHGDASLSFNGKHDYIDDDSLVNPDVKNNPETPYNSDNFFKKELVKNGWSVSDGTGTNCAYGPCYIATKGNIQLTLETAAIGQNDIEIFSYTYVIHSLE